MSIGRDEMLPMMLAAYQDFEPAYHEFLRDWEQEEDKPNYLAILELVVLLVEKLADRETRHFLSVFSVVERWLLEGDHYVQEAAVIGLLEGLQNTNHHQRGTTPSQFLAFLGPEATYWWEKVDQFWSAGRLIADDRLRH